MDITFILINILATISLLSALVLSVYLGKPGKILAYFITLVFVLQLVIINLLSELGLASLISLSLIVLLTIIAGLRVVASRYSHQYLVAQTKRAFVEILALLALWSGLSYLLYWFALDNVYLWGLVYGWLSFIVAIFILARVIRVLHKPGLTNKKDVAHDIPTITVAIPARNEDAVLERSLHQHLKSTYPKLEYLVLDDCSQDNTPRIIKSFAHDGVRFISGGELGKDWLGKNHAYQQLLDQASGEYILFCGADILLSPEAITEMLAQLRTHGLKMLAILPQYEPMGSSNKLWDVVQQMTRYYWQIAIMGLLSRRPATLGSAWLIEKQTLNELGGFKSVKRMTEPDRYFAKELSRKNQYALMSSKSLVSSVTSTKRPKQQYWHTLRVAYPLLKKSPTMTLAAVLGVIFFIFIPLSVSVLVVMRIVGSGPLMLLGLAGLLMLASFFSVFYFSSKRYSLLAPILFPFSLLQVMVLIVWSMMKYEFSDIEWKGRNVCIPVLDLKFQPPPSRRHRHRRHRHRRRH